MAAPIYTQNPDFRTEGVYVSEVPAPGVLEGVNNQNVVVFYGECVRGPVDKAVLCTSYARFRDIFGGRDKTALGTGGTILGKVWQSLQNKTWGPFYVVRAAATAGVAASYTAETVDGGAGTAIVRIDAANKGTWGNDVAVKVIAASNGNANHFDLLVKYLGTIYRLKNINLQVGFDNSAAAIAQVWDDDTKLITMTKLADGRPLTHTGTGVPDGADVDGYILLGQVIASYASVAGTDGSIADSDFTGTGRALEVAAAVKGAGVVCPGERMNATLKTKIATLAAAASDRVFLIGPDSEVTSVATAKADAITFMPNTRLTYCYGHHYTLDGDAGVEMLVRPESQMATNCAQTAAETHPGEESTKKFGAGIIRLYNEALSREDYAQLRDDCISALERDEGITFLSALVLDRAAPELTLRRIKDFLLLTIAAGTKWFVKKPGTPEIRAQLQGRIDDFLSDLRKAARIVEQFVIDMESLNTISQRAAGIEKPFLKVKPFGYMNFIHINAQIDPSLKFTEAA